MKKLILAVFILLAGGIVLPAPAGVIANPATAIAAGALGQGKDGWSFGYFATVGNPATFTTSSMTYSSGDQLWKGTSDFSTPQAGEARLHPAISGNAAARFDAARMWVSSFTGLVTISGTMQRLQGSGGDGVIGRIWVGSAPFTLSDFSKIGEFTILGTDNSLLTYSIPTTITAGQRVMFDLNANVTTDLDATDFSGIIVPEPVSLSLLAVPGLALLGWRRRV